MFDNPSAQVDLRRAKVVEPDEVYFLHVYEMGSTRPLVSIQGKSIAELKDMTHGFVYDGGMWLDLEFHLIHTLERFVIERETSEGIVVDEW